MNSDIAHDSDRYAKRGEGPGRLVSGNELPRQVAFRATALGALAVGALAVGALAIGHLAIGRFAAGKLAIGRGRIKRLEIDDLIVGRLRVREAVEPARESSYEGLGLS